MREAKGSSEAYPVEVGIGLMRAGFLTTRFIFLLGWVWSFSDSVARFQDPPAPASVLAGTEAGAHEIGVGSRGSRT